MARHSGLLALVFCGVLLVAPAASSAAQQGASCKPDQIEATGEIDFGQGLTKEQAEQKAYEEALRNAVRKACPAEVSSLASVLNNEMIVDLVKWARRGVPVETQVIERRTISEPVTREGVATSVERYRVTIRTRFAALAGEEDPGFEVRIVGMKPSYVEGDLMTVGVQAAADCYVHLFTVAADRSVTVFLPNKYRRENFLRKGETLEFPSADEERRGIRFRMGFLPGVQSPRITEWITAIATRRNVDLVSGTGIQEALQKVHSAKDTALIEELLKKVVQLRSSDVTQAVFGYEVFRKDRR